MNQHYRVRVCDKFVLNPMQERIIKIKIVDLHNCDTAQFIPTSHLLYQDSILLPHALINEKNNRALMTIINLSNRTGTILIRTHQLELLKLNHLIRVVFLFQQPHHHPHPQDDKLKKIDENVATHTLPGNGMMKVSLLLLNFFSTD
jgi:hypothetical protein